MSADEPDLTDAGLLGRRIPLNGTWNLRHTGGYRTADGQATRSAGLLRSDALHRLDDDGRAHLRSLGVRTIVDLRRADERALDPDLVEGVDARLIHVPLIEDLGADAAGDAAGDADDGADGGGDDDEATGGQTAPSPTAEDFTLADVYRLIVEDRGPAIAAVVRTLAAPDALPAIVHCTAGKDRTGIVVALVLAAVGVPDEQVAADFAATGLFLAALSGDGRQQLLRHGAAGGLDPERSAHLLGSDPELILGVLATVRATHGSAAGYLLAHGVTEAELEMLGRQLLDAPHITPSTTSSITPSTTSSSAPSITQSPKEVPMTQTDPTGKTRPSDDHRLVVQLSDIHILPEGQLYGRIDTLEVVAEALRSLENLTVPVDLLLLTGDLADHGQPESYRRLREVVEPAADRLGAQVLYMMGNHDARPAFRQGLLDAEPTEESVDRVMWMDGLRVIGLDSTVPGLHHGEIDQAQLEWLAAELAEPAPLGTIVAVHHPPIYSPLPLLQWLNLTNADQLAEVIDGTDVLLVVAGHTHHTTAGLLGGVPVWVATATAYQSDVLAPGALYRGKPGNAFTRIDVVGGRAYPTQVPIQADPAAEPLYQIDAELIRARLLDTMVAAGRATVAG